MSTSTDESVLSKTERTLTAAGAMAAVVAAEAKAVETGAPVVIAVVDGAGAL